MNHLLCGFYILVRAGVRPDVTEIQDILTGCVLGPRDGWTGRYRNARLLNCSHSILLLVIQDIFNR